MDTEMINSLWCSSKICNRQLMGIRSGKLAISRKLSVWWANWLRKSRKIGVKSRVRSSRRCLRRSELWWWRTRSLNFSGNWFKRNKSLYLKIRRSKSWVKIWTRPNRNCKPQMAKFTRSNACMTRRRSSWSRHTQQWTLWQPSWRGSILRLDAPQLAKMPSAPIKRKN